MPTGTRGIAITDISEQCSVNIPDLDLTFDSRYYDQGLVAVKVRRNGITVSNGSNQCSALFPDFDFAVFDHQEIHGDWFKFNWE